VVVESITWDTRSPDGTVNAALDDNEPDGAEFATKIPLVVAIIDMSSSISAGRLTELEKTFSVVPAPRYSCAQSRDQSRAVVVRMR